MYGYDYYNKLIVIYAHIDESLDLSVSSGTAESILSSPSGIAS